jgi:ParB family chromosome partitioning protein
MDTTTPAYREIPIDQIRVSTRNPRAHLDDAALQDLTASVKTQGILVPLIVRPLDGGGVFDLIAGERRLLAARAAGLTVVPARILEADDTVAREVAIIENLQRENIPPLDEAKAFKAPTGKGAPVLTAVCAIAQRLGKSERYVWDRLKLLDLVPDAQRLLEQGRFTVPHAILLARLTPEQQTKAIEPVGGALFTDDRAFEFDAGAEKGDRWRLCKPCSVRELRAWIADHVRFDAGRMAAVAPLDFGPVAQVVEAAAALPGRGKKVVQITHDYRVQPDAWSTERTFTGKSWKRATGEDKKSPTCRNSVLGVITVGPGYGDAFQVCVNKECDVHWGQEKRDREKQQKARTGGGDGAASKNAAREHERALQRQAIEVAKRDAWEKAIPAIGAATTAAVKRAKPMTFAPLLLGRLGSRYTADAKAALGSLKTADDLVRHLALEHFFSRIADTYWGPRDFPKRAKALGINLEKILKATAEPETEAVPAPGKKTTKAARKKQ